VTGGGGLDADCLLVSPSSRVAWQPPTARVITRCTCAEQQVPGTF